MTRTMRVAAWPLAGYKRQLIAEDSARRRAIDHDARRMAEKVERAERGFRACSNP